MSTYRSNRIKHNRNAGRRGRDRVRPEKITNLPYRLVRDDSTEVTFKTLPEAKRAALRGFEHNGTGADVFWRGRLVFFVHQLELPFQMLPESGAVHYLLPKEDAS